MIICSKLRALLAVAVLAALVTACAGRQTVSGECRSVYDGDICTWGTLAGGKVIEFGATVPLATVENAPSDGPMVFPPVPLAVIPLPAAVVRDTGFNHLSVNWEFHGHPPALFFTPHFDFHFYTSDPESVNAIDCSDSRKPAHIPTGYVLPDIEIPDMGTMIGLCVPLMGMHSMPAAELAQTEPFEASVLLGYYQQEPIFVEPMISRAKLMGAKSFVMTMPEAPENSAAMRWPGRVEAIYDSRSRSYRIVFSSFAGG